MKKTDIWILIAIIALSLTPLLLLGPGHGDTAVVTVKKDGAVLYSGPVQKNRVVHVPGTGNTVTIENGKVWMSEADCRDGLCLKEGYADGLHPIVCLPHRITVTVSEETAGYDAIAK